VTRCENCHADSATYLCADCQRTLREHLLRAPTIVDYLHDAAVGNVKLGDNARRTPSDTKGVQLNPKASALAAKLEDTLRGWAENIAATNGIAITTRPRVPRTPTVHALFLATHIKHLAAQRDSHQLLTTLRDDIRTALVLINRPIPPQFCGPCPTIITDHSRCKGDCNGHRHDCGTRLMARRGAIEVRCPACGTTHNVEQLINHLLARADSYRCTIPEIHRVLRMLGTPVPMRTLYHWADPKVGKLKPAGYLRPDNRRIGVARTSPHDKPVYRVADARKAREESSKPGRRGRPLGGRKRKAANA